MRRKSNRRKSKLKKFCDPAVCDCCLYVGEGDFLCDQHMEIVVSDWEPTESYLMCQIQHKAIGGGEHD
ncbi:MAG: hypothetical protein K2O18_06830 [Oscillospiraceae bacterium]|nr:hypothetical protein [Oscillospiraceae bacterium]